MRELDSENIFHFGESCSCDFFSPLQVLRGFDPRGLGVWDMAQ